MLNTLHLLFPPHVSLEQLQKVLAQSGAKETDASSLKWIVTVPPDRHVRFWIVDVEENLELDENEYVFFSKKLQGINTFGLFVEMSSAEKQGRLAAKTADKILDNLGGILIDEKGKWYLPSDVSALVGRSEGFYE